MHGEGSTPRVIGWMYHVTNGHRNVAVQGSLAEILETHRHAGVAVEALYSDPSTAISIRPVYVVALALAQVHVSGAPSAIESSLIEAANRQDTKAFRAALPRGDVSSHGDLRRSLVLQLAAWAGETTVIEQMIREADLVRATGWRGMTALHCAAANGHISAARLLAKTAGAMADVNAFCWSAADLAVHNRFGHLVPELVALGSPAEGATTARLLDPFPAIRVREQIRGRSRYGESRYGDVASFGKGRIKGDANH
jgi:hypothetical protein